MKKLVFLILFALTVLFISKKIETTQLNEFKQVINFINELPTS